MAREKLILLVLFFSTAGKVNHIHSICTDVVYISACQVQISCYPAQPYKLWCTNPRGTIIGWEVKAQNNIQRHLSFSSFDAIGKKKSVAVGSFTAVAEKVAGNTSSVTTSIMFMQSVDSLLSVHCNEKNVIFEHTNECKYYFNRCTLVSLL